jgi:peptidoglycan/xylan/chitin deacetylase (PgdA/CDA1 family)
MTLETLARKTVKLAALPFGLAAARHRSDLVILLYHRVGLGENEIDLPAEAFRRQLESLLEHERVLTLDQAVMDGSHGGVVVTFDDGSRDFHEVVLPMLVQYRVPALLYLATGWVDGNGGRRADAVTWPQLREAVDTGLVTVGAHTHSHVSLSRASEDEAERELRRSKELVEDRLSLPCRHFAYPFAVGSAAADRVARRLFDTAALHAWRTNRRGRIDRHRLGRTPVLRSDGPMFFRAKVRGLLNAEALAYRALRRGPWGRM